MTTPARARRVPLTDNVRTVLERCVVDGNVLRLPGQLSRDHYVAVNKALDAMGGKWSRKHKGHIFPEPVQPLLDELLDNGTVPPKNPTAFFWTPRDVALKLCEAVGLLEVPHAGGGISILEPSAGEGHIARVVREVLPAATLHCVEIVPRMAQMLRDQKFVTFEGDFLAFGQQAPTADRRQFTASFGYDRIIMNPPFAVEGDATAWLTHIRHARTLLKPDGLIAAIVPAGTFFRSDKKHVQFRAEMQSLERLPESAFAESGTNVNTALAVIGAAP